LAEGRRLLVGDLRDLDDQFDVILMNHTLEHIHDPVAFLRAAAALMASNGRLVINVPNYRSPVAMVMRDQWVGWLPTEHVFHYTEASLAAVAAKAGLRLVESSTPGVIEPPSLGVRGAIKGIVTAVARCAGWGDQVSASFTVARP
jgi:SAM-dependent methyltransferase